MAGYTGVYYIDVGSYDDSSAGDYRLNVTAFQTPPVFTNDQIAEQLVSGYWGDGAHPFNVSTGGTITKPHCAHGGRAKSGADRRFEIWAQITGTQLP